jgi:hypothetical protein
MRSLFLVSLLAVAWLLTGCGSQHVPYTMESLAFDPSNSGRYAIIDNDGSTTDKIIRILQSEQGWVYENKQEDGTWLCEAQNCSLQISNSDQIKRLMQSEQNTSMSAQCLNNQTFAFCSSKMAGEDQYAYTAYTLSLGGFVVTSMKLERLNASP